VAERHALSLKVGTSHGLWQYKLSGTHERVIVHGMRHILDATCLLLGLDRADREAIYLFHFSAEPFQGYHVCLEKMKEVPGTGCYYRVHHSTIGALQAKGLIPAPVGTRYLHGWPDRIFFTLEKSAVGGVVS
jgi:hypothetical protein